MGGSGANGLIEWNGFEGHHTPLINPLSPNIHIQMVWKVWKEFDKRSKHFLLGDHFINSHNLIS